MKNKILKLTVAAFTIALMFTVAMSIGVSAEPAEFNAVEEPFPEKNLLRKTSFDGDDWAEGIIKGMGSSLNRIETPTGSYLQYDRITANDNGITLGNPNRAILPGTYKLTCYLRMMYVDEVTELRVILYDYNSTRAKDAEYQKIGTVYVYPTHEEWTKVELYFTCEEMFGRVLINGGPKAEFVQPYCIDNVSLVEVDSIPQGYTIPQSIGTPVTAAQAVASQVDSLFYYPKYNEEFEERYDSQGIILNLDSDGLLGGDLGTRADLEAYARGYEGSQVTDFMMAVNTTVVTYPSKVWTSITDKYNQKIENGIPVNYKDSPKVKNAYTHFVTQKLDYFDIFCETFKEIGINPWISFRMNDSHDLVEKKTSQLLSDFFHKNPQLRRVHHKDGATTSNKYYFNSMNYTNELVREHMLALINEALGRYDCYGIELDWQRDLWLFHPGGEYNGIEILNDFMREVEKVVAVYEEKYGHELKICVRVASDIETNYQFGLDVLTWASEGIIDLVIPTGRYATVDGTVPVSLWTSMMHPYGVEVAPCIEANISNYAGSATGKHSLATYNGYAATFLSQGADKVAIYNYYLGSPTQAIQDKHKVSTTDETVAGSWRHWVIMTTIGSYDKLMTLDRRVVLTYNDMHPLWANSPAQLPVSRNAGEAAVLKIPVGDISSEATVTLKIGVNAANISKRPTVYVNGQEVTFGTFELCEEGYSKNQILCFNVPASAFTSPQFIVEIIPQRNMTLDHAEVVIDMPE